MLFCGNQRRTMRSAHGRHVEETNGDETLVSESFAKRNDLKPGDVVRVDLYNQ
jgi:hypothetical protein